VEKVIWMEHMGHAHHTEEAGSRKQEDYPERWVIEKKEKQESISKPFILPFDVHTVHYFLTQFPPLSRHLSRQGTSFCSPAL
jgi:hypothetical protein